MPHQYRTPEQQILTWRRGERTRRATSIKSTLRVVLTVTDSATLPFWRDDVLYTDVRKLVRQIRVWGWIEGDDA